MKQFILTNYYSWNGDFANLAPKAFSSIEEAKKEQERLLREEIEFQKQENEKARVIEDEDISDEELEKLYTESEGNLFLVSKPKYSSKIYLTKCGESSSCHIVWDIAEIEIEF